MEDGYVLVIGSAGIDIKGKPESTLEWGHTNLGRVRTSVSGVARNIAENLARLEVRTVLISAVGHDAAGSRVLRKCKASGIDVAHVRVMARAATASHTVMYQADGDLLTAVADYNIMQFIDSDFLLENEVLLAEAAMVVIDATLSEAALATLFELAARHRVRISGDPTLPALAGRFCEHLHEMYMVSPNAAETTALCGLENPAHDRETAIDAARHLVMLGTEIAVVTVGERGLAYADSSGGGFIPAINTRVVDTSGAGDAFSGAVIFGLLNDVPVDEAMRLGVTAASLTLQSKHNVVPNLSQEMLYDELTI